MKNVPMLAMLAAPYLLMGHFLSANTKGFSVVLAVFVIVMLLGALNAFRLLRLGYDGRRLLFWCMLMKLCNIPIFCLIFIMVIGFFPLLIPVLPFLFLFDGLLLLSTSMYGINGLLACGRECSFDKKTIIVNMVLQLIFCTDVFSSVYCYIRARANRRRGE